VTAPELSPLFARCLAHTVAAALEQLGGGEVVEFGAGSGAMAGELVAALGRLGTRPSRYRIVESSPRLAERQRHLLGHAAGAASLFEWLDAPPEEEWRGVAIANELIDALPVDRFRVTESGCEALCVAATKTRFEWRARPAQPALAAAVAEIQARLPSPMREGFVSEWRPGQAEWLAAAARGLARGAILVSDYGLPRDQYYHASRDGGTLCAFRRHLRVEDVLENPGAQDLTAWVDFSALADDAHDAGLEVAGFATQAHFLVANGIDRELARLVAGADEHGRIRHRQRAATLLLPGEMGERFKFLALTRGLEQPLPGFGFRDLTASL
jgi:SAM-dependent MidA family methyltransferase